MYIEKSTLSSHLSEKTSVSFKIFFSKEIIDYMDQMADGISYFKQEAN